MVTDATILARVVDTTLIVVAHQETKKENLDKVQRSIKNVGGNLAGVVINKIPMTVKKYQDYYYWEYYGNPQDLAKSQKSNQDLYLRGKATILEDRQKNRNSIENIGNSYSTTDIRKETNSDQNSNSTIGETEEMLKRMNEYLEQQKRNMNQ